MKWIYRFILPVLLLLSIEAKSQAYTYHPLIDTTNTIWTVGCTQHSTHGSMDYYYQEALMGDTIVNGSAYRIVSASYLMREDSLKRVFCRWISWLPTDTDKLIFDFDLNKGDSVSYYIFTSPPYGPAWDKNVVTSVDTVMMNGTLRRRMFLGDSSDAWIGGIGSIHYGLCMSLGCGGDGGKVCSVVKDSVLVYEDSFCVHAPISNGFGDEFIINFAISPNPSSTSFTIQLSSPPITQTYFNLYDALGRTVKREEINSETTTIQRNNLPRGIYFWQLQQGYKIVGRGKVVIE